MQRFSIHWAASASHSVGSLQRPIMAVEEERKQISLLPQRAIRGMGVMGIEYVT